MDEERRGEESIEVKRGEGGREREREKEKAWMYRKTSVARGTSAFPLEIARLVVLKVLKHGPAPRLRPFPSPSLSRLREELLGQAVKLA